MLSFMEVGERRSARGTTIEVYPEFIVNQRRDTDLMTRGGDFYAVWDEAKGRWSTTEQDALDMIDRELLNYVHENEERLKATGYKVLLMKYSSNRMISNWHLYVKQHMRSNYTELDEALIFANTPTSRTNYSSKSLPYPLAEGDYHNFDKLIGTLYSPEERHKLEWAIGSVVSGDSKELQKFLVLYGSAGTGKSTILNIIQKLFDGYYCVFDAKALGSSNNAFALEAFRSNPLVAIQHDGDLSHIEDNTRINSIVSHEEMMVNEKFKATYTSRFKCLLLMGTNKPVKITDAKSGLLRRLIDVTPTGNKLPVSEYRKLVKGIDFELGAIAKHCLDVYLADPNAYDDYIPVNMLGASNDFYNFVMDNYFDFKEKDSTSLAYAWDLYKAYCDNAKVPYPYSQRSFKEELKNYFKDYKERGMDLEGNRVRSVYTGFRHDKFEAEIKSDDDIDIPKIEFGAYPSIFDSVCAKCKAQYASVKETPSDYWDSVSSTLSDLDTHKLHYVCVPDNHIVIDFDIPGEDGKKSFEKNLEAASKWPPTYAELSKSGAGIHLHYIYAGDPTQLAREYAPHIEIKVYTGNASLRRKLTKCNNQPIATLTSNLPLKEKKMVNFEGIKDEQNLRNIIKKAMRKEIFPNTKPTVDFIKKVLDDAYASGLVYDVSNMHQAILIFAMGSTNNKDYCVKQVAKMKFTSEKEHEGQNHGEGPKMFFDIESFPNLFLINWKLEGIDHVHRMINPRPEDVKEVFIDSGYLPIGFNNRKYDNHMVWAAMEGYSPNELFQLSGRIINQKSGFFGPAYNLSYTDVYDFAAKKQSLKKWEIELGIHHHELGLPWDQPVPKEKWDLVAEYCDDDVIATEAVFHHLKGDWTARLILADVAGMTPNDTTNQLTTRIIFGKEKHPKLVYTNLEEEFPGYSFEDGHNMYRGVDLGFGGYVYAQPGMYSNIALLDVASLHPHSIKAMNCFGEYTKNFTDIMDTRIFIKHKDYESAKKLFDGKLAKYLDDPAQAKALSQALKIAINSVYGLTSATFDNPFKDPRNKNNIVALRGALFMKTLQDEVTAMGYKVVHIKTDSIKIANADQKIIDFCMNFAQKYGYTFEHEATYSKICLVNNAVYIARYSDDEKINGDHVKQWTATGTQFQIPYVFKTLFSKEEIEFRDLCETKQVKDYLYLDMNESNPDDHNYQFIGKVGLFCPIKPGCGGGELVVQRDKKGVMSYDSATGAKGYRWLEAEFVEAAGKQNDIDMRYYHNLVDEAVTDISAFGNFDWFVSDDMYDFPVDEELPW